MRILACAALTLAVCLAHGAQFADFVRVQGDQLTVDGKPFRFISWNIPNLHLVEDQVPFEFAGRGAVATPPVAGWRLPDRFEITDALATVRQMGGQVARTYVISVQRADEDASIPRHVLAPGKFNEEAFKALDLVLQIANEQGIRIIIPFVDNWHWWGGRAQYAGFRGKTKEQFWTDPQVLADFKETIRFVVTRTNSLTGVRYADDKAILCWETGNELECPPSFTREIAGYIKSLDRNHLVMEGFHSTELREESLQMPEVDIVTTHHYPGSSKTFAQLIRENAAKAKGRKPYVVGEFGFVPTREMADAIEATVTTQTAGALAWSLRFRSRDGGFYWHSEPAGGNKYKAFHWPGSPIADDYDEIPFMKLMREKAYEARGLPVPSLSTPSAPNLLQITDASAIRWQGSVGASSYQVERAMKANGPWRTVATEVDESFTQYRPQFGDESVPRGTWFYRVRARNTAGVSEPSNVVGPVKVTETTKFDEMADFSRMHAHQGDLEIKTRDCRTVMEDAHRVGGKAGSTLVYKLDAQVRGGLVYVFFPGALADLKFGLSVDGKTFRPASAPRTDFPYGAGDYGYLRRAIYELPAGKAKERFLRIEFTGDAQISRVELRQPASRR